MEKWERDFATPLFDEFLSNFLSSLGPMLEDPEFHQMIVPQQISRDNLERVEEEGGALPPIQSDVDSEIEALISEIATLEFKVSTFKVIRSIANRFEQDH